MSHLDDEPVFTHIPTVRATTSTGNAVTLLEVEAPEVFAMLYGFGVAEYTTTFADGSWIKYERN